MTEEPSLFEAAPEERFLRLDGRIPFVTSEILIRTAAGTEITRDYDTLSLPAAVHCAKRDYPQCQILNVRRRVDLPEEDHA
jgi:hypothetical protein